MNEDRQPTIPGGGGGGNQPPPPDGCATLAGVSTDSPAPPAERRTHSAPTCPTHGAAPDDVTADLLRYFVTIPTVTCAGCLDAARDWLAGWDTWLATLHLAAGSTWHRQDGPGQMIVSSVSTDRTGTIRGVWAYDPATGALAETFLSLATLRGLYVPADEVCAALAAAAGPIRCRWCDAPATGTGASKGLCDRHSFPADRPAVGE